MQLFDSHVATIKALIIKIYVNRFLVKKNLKTISGHFKNPDFRISGEGRGCFVVYSRLRLTITVKNRVCYAWNLLKPGE